MKYQEYIKLGFERTEMNDNVELDATGYTGYCLEKKINDKMRICVAYPELDKPSLYIRRRGKDNYHILPITGEMVKDIILEDRIAPNFTSVA